MTFQLFAWGESIFCILYLPSDITYNLPHKEIFLFEALLELERFEDKWGDKYPYIGKSWRDSWDNLSTFFKYSPQIRRLIYTTNPIESLNSQIRRVTRNKGVYPNEDALFKILYLAVISVTNKWTSKIRGGCKINCVNFLE